MTYRLFIGGLGVEVAEDQYAFDWLNPMRERGYDDVRIEPYPGASPPFPFGDDDTEEQDLPVTGTTARCRHCNEVKAVPGIDRLFAFVCPQLWSRCGSIVPRCYFMSTT